MPRQIDTLCAAEIQSSRILKKFRLRFIKEYPRLMSAEDCGSYLTFEYTTDTVLKFYIYFKKYVDLQTLPSYFRCYIVHYCQYGDKHYTMNQPIRLIVCCFTF